MSAAPFTADAFGFTQAASRISTTLMDTANHVGFAIKRSAALLRAVHLQLLNDDPCNLNAYDVETLLELALSALPDPDGDAFNTFENCGLEASETVKAMLAQQQAMTAMLTALEVAADLGSTREELNEVADSAYAAANTLPDGQRHWDAFCALVTRRGLHIELLNLGLGYVAAVHTEESRKRAAKLRHKADALGKEARAVDQAPQPRKRRQGKA